MNNKSEDIVESKIGPGWFKINLRALLGGFGRSNNSDYTGIVTDRFLQIFNGHGVATTEIPRLIPEVTLDKLESRESLLSVLSNELIDKVCDLFLVNRSWLEGNSDRIYDRQHCYKQPEVFFEELSKLDLEDFIPPVIAFTSKSSLNYRKGRGQPVQLVFQEKCAQIGSKDIYRYVVWSDAWDWGYPKTRVQIKALVRLTDMKLQTTVPIYRVDSRELKKLERGKVFPYQVFLDSKRLPFSLEDFTESIEEHGEAKEQEELPAVMKYIVDYDLEDVFDSLILNN